MSYGDYEVPDGITPLVGFRGWLIKDAALWSVYPDIRKVEWPVGSPLNSECLPPNRRVEYDDPRIVNPPKHYWAPHIACTCGIYALHDYPKPWTELDGKTVKADRPWPSSAVTGMIHGWGHIVVGDKGFRAQYAKPIALVSHRRHGEWPKAIQEVAYRYGLEVITAQEARK